MKAYLITCGLIMSACLAVMAILLVYDNKPPNPIAPVAEVLAPAPPGAHIVLTQPDVVTVWLGECLVAFDEEWIYHQGDTVVTHYYLDGVSVWPPNDEREVE